MKKLISYLTLFLLIANLVVAQNNDHVIKEASGKPINVKIKIPEEKPDVYVQSIAFENTSTGQEYGLNDTCKINFEQSGLIKLSISNKGEGIAKGLSLSVNEINSKGLSISVPNSGVIGDLNPGESKNIVLHLTTGMLLENSFESIFIKIKDINSNTNLTSNVFLKTIEFYTGYDFDQNNSKLLDYYSKYILDDAPQGALRNYEKDILKELNEKNYMFEARGEFELPQDYEKRKEEAQKYKNDLLNKYIQLYYNKKKEKIAESYHEIPLKIRKISVYDATVQKFIIAIDSSSYDFFIPADEAKSFKENFHLAKVTGIERLRNDLLGYEVINIKVYHPVLIDNFYKIGPQTDVSNMQEGVSISSDNVEVSDVTFTCKYNGQTSNTDINALEAGYIVVVLKNSGKAKSGKITVYLKEINKVEGIIADYSSKSVPGLNPGKVDSVTFILYAKKEVGNSKYMYDVNIEVSSGNFDKKIVSNSINTNAYRKPE